jgi:hypothetical protein
MSSSSATSMFRCWTRVRIGSAGRPWTEATATEWWRSLTRRHRISSLTPLIVSSMWSDSRASSSAL